MKKTLRNFAGILIAIFVVFSLLDMKGDYVVERILWKTNKRLSEAARNPEAVPDKVFEQIASQYQKVIKDFPKSKLIPATHIFLGRVYTTKKDYDTARKHFQETCDKFPQNITACAQALSSIASSYESQGNWPAALKTYEKIKNDYPATELGLRVPLYVAVHYQRINHSVNAQNAFDEATNYYAEFAKKYPDSEAGFRSRMLLSSCYIEQKKWSQAVDVMGKTILEYPAPSLIASLVKTINAISLAQIKEYGPAIRIYQDFIAKNPKNPFNENLNKMIKAFKDLEEKKVAVNP